METPILTTMVVLYTMGVRLDTNVLVNNLPLTEGIIKIEKQGILRRGESKKDKVRHRKIEVGEGAPVKRNTGFGHNSITLVLLSNGDGTLREKEITVKIFQNGIFHITGVLDEKYDRDAVARLQKHITEYCPESIREGEWTPENRRVVLMNYKTNLIGVKELSREQLYQSVKKQGLKTVYEPDVYPGVKIYFANTRWIAKVFRTGNIILTGVTTTTECAEFADKLHHVLLGKV